MDFAIPDQIQATLDALDAFIEAEIEPLQHADDNMRFFDHRREWARTDWENDGVPNPEWEDLLAEMRRRADAAGWLRWALPSEFGGHDASNLEMAIIREHLAHRGLGLHNDLQNESSIVGNFPTVLMMRDFGTPEQIAEWMPGFLDGSRRLAFGLTEPNHGSDATYMETTAVRDGDGWVINGMKRWNTGVHTATHDIIFARTSGSPARGRGSPPFWCQRLILALRSSSTGGRSTCRAIMRRCASPTSGSVMTPFLVMLAVALNSRSISFMRTVFGRRHRRWVRVSTASILRWRTHVNASPGVSRWPSTKASSSPWWSYTPKRRCCVS